MLNRRNHTRHHSNATVVFFKNEQPLEARLVDLADGGVCIEQAEEVAVGTECKVMIQLSPFQFQTARGRVVRVSEGRLGIRFDNEFASGWASKIAA